MALHVAQRVDRLVLDSTKLGANSPAGFETARWSEQESSARADDSAETDEGQILCEMASAARETYQRLATPWEKLFGALESAASDRVTLVAVEPDAKSGTVKISGEGRDYPAVLDYVVQLRANPTLAGAHLVKHEARQDGPQGSVAFSVAAAWGEVKP